MKNNLGSVDRTVRLLGALAIVILYFTDQINGTAAVLLGIVALLLVGTSLAAHCPVYPIFRFSTRKKEHKEFSAQ